MDRSGTRPRNEPIEHGGDPDRAERRYGRPRGGWLDLSTGINPNAYPVGRVAPDAWRRLPDGAALAALSLAAANCYGVRDPALVVAAPGTQALLQWLPRLCPPGTVAVISPTYAEHARCWKLAGHRVAEVADLAAAGACGARVVVAVNPNNPDGRRFAPRALAALARALARRHRLLVVDEAFADVAPDISVASRAGTAGLVILRSFGKFFGLAGVRLGFALAPAPLAEALRQALGSWAVSGPAAALGVAALSDRRWQARTRRALSADTARLRALLETHGLQILGGTDLFVLAGHPSAGKLWETLARRGVLARRFADHPCWLRFGLPGRESDWQKLARALAGFSVSRANR